MTLACHFTNCIFFYAIIKIIAKRRFKLNDKQRTILGVVAVFALVAVAGVSFALMRTGSGSIKVSADVEVTKQCVDNPMVETGKFKLELTSDQIKFISLTDSPAVSLRVITSGVTEPQLRGSNAIFTAGTENSYILVYNAGAQQIGSEISLPISYVAKGDSPCLQVEVSTDGVAYYSQVASINLK